MALSDQVVKKDPQNVEAKAVKGHAALKEGKVNEADRSFRNWLRKVARGRCSGRRDLLPFM